MYEFIMSVFGSFIGTALAAWVIGMPIMKRYYAFENFVARRIAHIEIWIEQHEEKTK